MDEQPRELEGATILIVDDEFLIAADIEYLFRDVGAKVTVLNTLSAGLAAARRDNFTAALLDIRLGADSSEAIAEVLMRRGIPFLFFSGQRLPAALREKFPHAPALLKPMGFRDLVGATSDLLHNAAH